MAYSVNAVVEPQNKLVWLTTVSAVAGFEKIFLRDGLMSVKLLDELFLRAEFIALPMKTFSPFFEEFKRTTQLLVEMGFKTSLINNNFELFKTQHESIDDGIPPLVLSMDDLSIGFLVCLVPLCLGVVTFIIEVAMPKLQGLTSYERDLLTFLHLIYFLSKVPINLN